MSNAMTVKATWDDDANVWYARSDDVQGLAIEAAALEELQSRILTILPELVELNGPATTLPEIAVHIKSDTLIHIANPKAE